MNYPNDFDTPTFPAGKSIAVSRSISIWFAVVSVLIIAACVILLSIGRVKKNYPFVVSIDPLTNDWNVIAYPDKTNSNTIEQYQVIQEKLVNDYVTNWFTISSDQSTNASRWERCEEEDCNTSEQVNPNNSHCLMYCMSSDSLFNTFYEQVVPEYKERLAQREETWKVKKILISSNKVSKTNSSWQVYAEIVSSVNGKFNVLSFIDIAQDKDGFPATLGYYVESFYAYRVDLNL